jgi:ribosomal protein L37AE/L43A
MYPSGGGVMTERATPFYCPYCGDEDLRPEPEPHGAWRCGACRRVFAVKFVGLAVTEVAQ